MQGARVFRRLAAWLHFRRRRGRLTGRLQRLLVEPKEAASPLSDYPSLVVKPGSYPCVIEHPSGQRLAAELDLGAGRSPQGQVFGWPVEERDGIRTVPQPAERYPLLKCGLRAGWEVLLIDATVQAWFPEQASLHASLAVAGHGLSADPGRCFPEVSVQITEGHRLFGRAPLTKVTFPTSMPETGKVEFSVEVDRDANVTYSNGGTELRCGYWMQTSLTDYRRFFVTTAPVFEIRSATPLTPGEWMTTHVLPLRELVTLATLEPQTVAWATLDEQHGGVSTEGSTRSFQLYSQDIQQAPYAPAADPHKESRTLFTFPGLPYSPVDLLRRWEDLRTAHRGFIQPLMQGLTEQMNPRARFLFLVQALEGLHTEMTGEGPVKVEQHRAKRKEVLQAVKDAGLDKDWADRWLDRHGRFSLAERLTQLWDAVRPDVERVADVDLVPGDIPDIRNRLSHGAEDYSWQALRPAMRVMSAIGAAHVLRLLDLPSDRLPMVFGQD
jgi:hypothetical protein